MHSRRVHRYTGARGATPARRTCPSARRATVATARARRGAWAGCRGQAAGVARRSSYIDTRYSAPRRSSIQVTVTVHRVVLTSNVQGRDQRTTPSSGSSGRPVRSRYVPASRIPHPASRFPALGDPTCAPSQQYVRLTRQICRVGQPSSLAEVRRRQLRSPPWPKE